MLGFSFSELLLIAVVGIVLIGPKDLPVVIRHVAKFLHELRSLYSGLKGHMDDFVREAGMDDLHQDLKRGMTTIIDLDGKPQQAFDVKELETLGAKVTGETNAVSLSPRERLGEGGIRAAGSVPSPIPAPSQSSVPSAPPAQAQPSPHPSPSGRGSNQYSHQQPNNRLTLQSAIP